LQLHAHPETFHSRTARAFLQSTLVGAGKLSHWRFKYGTETSVMATKGIRTRTPKPMAEEPARDKGRKTAGVASADGTHDYT